MKNHQVELWLLDNRYVLRRDTAGCCAELRAVRGLRRLKDGRLLISAAMDALVKSGGGSIGEERLRAFLTGFQKERPLEEKELALLPSFLRSSLICWLSSHAEEAERVLRFLLREEMEAGTIVLRRIDGLLNDRPLRCLGWRTPREALAAAIEKTAKDARSAA